jgi:hypothetical protein
MEYATLNSHLEKENYKRERETYTFIIHLAIRTLNLLRNPRSKSNVIRYTSDIHIHTNSRVWGSVNQEERKEEEEVGEHYRNSREGRCAVKSLSIVIGRFYRWRLVRRTRRMDE